MSRRFARPDLLPMALGLAAVLGSTGVHAQGAPVTAAQRSTAEQVASAGVPLADLVPDAPDSYTVKPRDTLWGISQLYLKTPWRWPELWGMNLKDIRNPHLIYPGQTLVLDRSGGRAQLRVAQTVIIEPAAPDTPPAQTLKPRIRETPLGEAIAAVPMHLIGPFLSQAVIFETDQLDAAPRVVETPDERVIVSRGDTIYVRGNVSAARSWHLYRQPRPLIDPLSGEVLGFEARHVGTGELVQLGSEGPDAEGKLRIVPSTFTISQVREEVMMGDRLAVAPPRDTNSFAPHAPSSPLSGQVVSIYGDTLSAGTSQIVSLNRGRRDGVERGHVLALWTESEVRPDRTDKDMPLMQMPAERRGLLFVFNVFERMSYALVLRTPQPVYPGSRFAQP